MSRSNWIIVGLGLLACVALSLLMEQVLKVHQSRSAGPITVAVQKAVGNRLDRPPAFRIETVEGHRTGELRLRPSLEANVLRLVRDAGERAWLTAGRDQFDTLVVVSDSGVGDIDRYEVTPPWKLGPGVVRVPDEPARPAALPAPGGAR